MLTRHFTTCREHALAVADETLRDVLLTYAAERYVETLTMAGGSKTVRTHLRGLRRHADVLADGVTRRVQTSGGSTAAWAWDVRALRLKQLAGGLDRL